jgi:uncharacterized protein YprB with RNaseH-like and TPR domain
MLQHTFCHLPGIGAQTERRLWAAGLTSWQAVLAQEPPRPAARRLAADLLRESARQHADHNSAWFAEHLPAAQHWRLFGDYRASCAYLDIETTGMGPADQITTIALYDGDTVRTYVAGVNLGDFIGDVAGYRLLITYNGKSFDVPILERCLRCRLPAAHIDLRHVLKSLGHSGGLKSCERQLGLERPGMEDLDGFAAVLLWHDFKRRRNPHALETLLAYNVQDTLNLEVLMVLAHNRKLAELADVPFTAAYRLPPPAPVQNPFTVDRATVARVLGQTVRMPRSLPPRF